MSLACFSSSRGSDRSAKTCSWHWLSGQCFSLVTSAISSSQRRLSWTGSPLYPHSSFSETSPQRCLFAPFLLRHCYSSLSRTLWRRPNNNGRMLFAASVPLYNVLMKSHFPKNVISYSLRDAAFPALIVLAVFVGWIINFVAFQKVVFRTDNLRIGRKTI